MKKLIDIPEEIVKDLKKMAIDADKDLKNFIQDHLVFLCVGRKKNKTLPQMSNQSEQLKAEVFTLANKLAVAGEGDAAVAMHRIHNRL